MPQEQRESISVRFFLGSHEFSDDEYVLKYKMITLSVLLNIMIIAVSAMGLFCYYNGNMTQAYADVFLVSSFVIGAIALRFSKRSYKFISRAVLFIALGLATTQLLWYPESESRVIWFSTTVYVGFFLLDRREGWFWISTIILGLLGLYFYKPSIVGLTQFEFATFVLNLVMIAILLNWYEVIKEKAYEAHIHHNQELEKSVLEKTQELQRLNATLYHRVDEEIDKNRDKEKQMIHQSRLAQMGEMISMIAHQWRQPLAAISATASALQLKIARKRYDEEAFLSSVKQINEYSQHLSSTIDDFRNFFSTNKEKSLFSFKEVVEGSLSIIKTSLENKNIKMSTEILHDEPIFSYPNEIRQVILNLLKNAEDILLEKKIENPHIHIRVSHLGPMMILEIGDNGGGVPDAIKDKIFDPYFTTKEKRDGTGLGLYMSKTIVEDHCGGKLNVYNSKYGAIFEISLRKTT